MPYLPPLAPTSLTVEGDLLSITALRHGFARSGSAAASLEAMASDITAACAGTSPHWTTALEACGWSVQQVAQGGVGVLRAGDITLTIVSGHDENIDVVHARLLDLRATRGTAPDSWGVCRAGDVLRLVPPRVLGDGPDAALTVDLSVLPHAHPTDALIVAALLDPRAHDAAQQDGRPIDAVVRESQRELAELLEDEARRYRATIAAIAAELDDDSAAARIVGRFMLTLLAHLMTTARSLRVTDPLQVPELPTTWRAALEQLAVACASTPDVDDRVPATHGLLDRWELARCAALDITDDTFVRILALTLRVGSEGGTHRPSVDLANVTPFEIGSLHESLLALVLPDGEVGSEVDDESERSAGGVFYTPLPLVHEVLRHVLDPVLEQRVGRASDPCSDILDISVCDPSCGSGNFLVPVARRLALAALEAAPQPVDLTTYRHVLTSVVERCVYGADRDDFAVRLARFGLRLLCDPTGRATPILGDRFAVGDSLVGAWPEDLQNIPDEALDRVAALFPESVRRWRRDRARESEGQGSLFDEPEAPERSSRYDIETADAWCDMWFTPSDTGTDPLVRLEEVQAGRTSERTTAPRAYLHWPLAFPALGDGPPLFDVVVGNPPYLRGRDHAQIDPEGRHFISSRFPACQGGMWNLFVPFILLAQRLARERSGLLVQSSVLGSQYAAALHEQVLANGGLAACLDFSGVPDLFPAAAVQVAALVLTPDADADARFVRYSEGLEVAAEVTVSPSELRRLPLGYWTLPTSGLDPAETALFTRASLRLGDVATIQDGMEQSAAYEVRPLVRESSAAGGELRLTPTGLIDPYVNRWGSKPVKYLGMRFDRPVLDTDALEEGGFSRMAAQGRAEKIAIAGLSTRIEAVVDEGTSLVSKSAFVIRLTDSGICPYAVAAALNSALMNRIYDAAFGAVGFGAGSRNYRPPTLSALPLPDRRLMARHTGEAVTDATRLSAIGQQIHQAATDGADLSDLLNAAELAVAASLGLDAPTTAENCSDDV